MYVQRTPQASMRVSIDYAEKIPIINRTNRVLSVVCDGRTFQLKPGKNMVPSTVVPYALKQHPQMGTFDATGLQGESLVGVEGMTPTTPIAPEDEARGLERFDRSVVPLTLPVGAKRADEMIIEKLPTPRQVLSEPSGIAGTDPRNAMMTNDNGGIQGFVAGGD